jgi:hypothetical protein
MRPIVAENPSSCDVFFCIVPQGIRRASFDPEKHKEPLKGRGKVDKSEHGGEIIVLIQR